jgi:hypothetical protein
VEGSWREKLSVGGREEREVRVSAWSRGDGGLGVDVDNISPSSRPAYGAVEGVSSHVLDYRTSGHHWYIRTEGL